MVEDIVHEATHPHPPAAVWRALTTREALGVWPRKVVGWDGVARCEVLEVLPERRLAVASTTAGAASRSRA